MALIQKAYSGNKTSNGKAAAGEPASNAGRGEGAMAADGRGVQRPRQPAFDLPLNRLREQGFFYPAETATRLDLELRLLKRRLLRKTGLLHRQYTTEALARRTSRAKNLIMVTSTRPNEGKTFVAINLALSLALEDEVNVLLADADLPRPKIRNFFEIDERPGLSDMIVSRDLAPADVCLNARGTTLSFLPEGQSARRPSELYGSSSAKQALNILSQWQADQLVILDAPPVLATTEAVLLAPYVDEILFVVEADATPEQAIVSAIEELLDVNRNISLVLNKCLIGAGGSHYGSYAEYYPRSARQDPDGSKSRARQRKGSKE